MHSLEELCGEHVLSGVETGYLGNARYIKFCLDGVCYIVKEDAVDDCRSFYDALDISEEPCKEKIPDTKVIGVMKFHYNVKDTKISAGIITFISSHNGLPVLFVGKNLPDSYYPVCIMDWMPGNLPCNSWIWKLD